jgi:hypothetical protein
MRLVQTGDCGLLAASKRSEDGFIKPVFAKTNPNFLTIFQFHHFLNQSLMNTLSKNDHVKTNPNKANGCVIIGYGPSDIGYFAQKSAFLREICG